MTLPGYDDAFERARDEPAFSNSTESEAWMGRFCYRCANDDEDGPGCPLVAVAMLGRTPAEWRERDRLSLGNQYECSLFSPRPELPSRDLTWRHGRAPRGSARS